MAVGFLFVKHKVRFLAIVFRVLVAHRPPIQNPVGIHCPERSGEVWADVRTQRVISSLAPELIVPLFFCFFIRRGNHRRPWVLRLRPLVEFPPFFQQG